MSGGKKAAIIVAGVLVVVLALAGAAYGIFHHYYSLLGNSNNNDPNDQYWLDPDETLERSPTTSEGPAESVGPTDTTGPADTFAPTEPDSEAERIERELMENLQKMEENSSLYSNDAFNIILIGVDSRKDSFAGRSDSMILLSINKTTKKVVMTSFLRDIFCSIPGYSSNRLNVAYAYGGPDLLKQTIKANFGISIDRCVVVNFYLVMDAVDAVDGIDMELTAAEIGYMNRYIKEQNRLMGKSSDEDQLPQEDSTYHLNGNQALAYARVRYVGTDFARTNRQRTVIMKCVEKVKTMGIGKLTELAEEFLPEVRTDLTEGDCASLLLTLLGISDYTIESMAVPVDGTWEFAAIRGMDVITLDFEANAKAWHAKVEGTAQ